jgi:hypothetical protein
VSARLDGISRHFIAQAAGLPLRGTAPRRAMLAANAGMRDTVTDVLALVRAERRRNK